MVETETITEELEYQPGELFVKRYVWPKYARPESDGVVVSTLPLRPIEKGLAGPGLIVRVLGSKFVDIPRALNTSITKFLR